MYSVSHAALWRKANGKLKPAYHYFGYLRPNKLISVGTKVQFYRDKCPICKQPRKRITRGLKISDSQPHNNLIRTRQLSFVGISRDLWKRNYKDGNLNIKFIERDIELSTNILYKHIVPRYRINDIADLRES